jgi:hypothetical protein
MPSKPSRKDVVGTYIELDRELRAAMITLARRNARTFREEVESALRRHLAAPPVRQIIERPVPKLPPAPVEVERPRRR